MIDLGIVVASQFFTAIVVTLEFVLAISYKKYEYLISTNSVISVDGASKYFKRG